MKIHVRLSLIASLATAILFAPGCASSDDDNILVKAGFDPLRANTTEQLNLISKLNPYQILVLHKDGRTFYAFPDPVHSQIYVGNQSDYARYQKIRASQNAATREAELPLVENQGGPILNAWSDWKGWSV